jgi:tryptophanase
MPNGRYHEVSDQPAMSALLDIDEALAGSRSFRKFVKECDAAFGVNA